MRILIATDGSACAEKAVALAAGIRWPEGSTMRVVSAVDTAGAVASAPWMAMAGLDLAAIDESLIARSEAAISRARRALPEGHFGIESVVVRGRSASAIVDEAARWHADLLVVGSRGHGRIATMLLGSVSAEAVDEAPCPVLVARRVRAARAMLAHDGSPTAEAAERLVVALPVFRDIPVDVVSVGRPPSWSIGDASFGRSDLWLDAYRQQVETTREVHERIAGDAAERLLHSGIDAHPVACAGDPAETIVSLAEGRGIDLIVMGSHGRTGPDRLRLGSVARNVLLHTGASVLVTRAGAQVPSA